MLSPEERQLLELQAQICQVLASPKRLEVLYTLKHREMTAGELAQALETSPPNLSQHLAMMRKAGVVAARKEGANTYYRIAIPHVLEACRVVREVLSESVAQQRAVLEGSVGPNN